MLHGHGDDGYRHGVPVRANFSSNVRRGRHTDGLRVHLFETFQQVACYPEVAAESLAKRIAVREDIDPSQVVVTAGATGAIYLIAQAHRRRRSYIVTPTFSEYADACAQHEHQVEPGTRAGFQVGQFAEADLVWLCNPNNPTGEVFSREAVLAVVAGHPQTTFVIDVAYAGQCDEVPVRAGDVVSHPNLIVVRSLTKEAGTPGLRLGYVAASAEKTAELAARNPPWSVGALEQQAGHFLLSQSSDPASRRQEYLAEARRFAAALGAIGGLEVSPSATGFFIVRLKRGTGAELKAHLLERHGLLIRDASNFPGLDESYVRISTQTPEENRWLEEALAAWMRS